MFLSGNAPASVAAAVWAASTRTLTSIGGINMGGIATANITVPAASLVDFRPTSSNKRELSVALHTTVPTSGTIQMYNGTTLFPGVNVPANSSDMIYGIGNAAIGMAVGNSDPSLPASAQITGWDWT